MEPLVDSHCHLDFPEIRPRLETVLARMEEALVRHALVVGVKQSTWARLLEVAEGDPRLYAALGVHPNEEGFDGEEQLFSALMAALDHLKAVAVGETGLDYYRNRVPEEIQQKRLRVHIAAARQKRLPLVIHCRQAAQDTLRILEEEKAAEVGGVLHCFTESLEVARHAIALNFHISFSGILTFKNADDLRRTASFLPLDRLLVETDSPYLAPEPYRRQVNEPALVRQVAKALADARQEAEDLVAAATTRNFFSLFSRARPCA